MATKLEIGENISKTKEGYEKREDEGRKMKKWYVTKCKKLKNFIAKQEWSLDQWWLNNSEGEKTHTEDYRGIICYGKALLIPKLISLMH